MRKGKFFLNILLGVIICFSFVSCGPVGWLIELPYTIKEKKYYSNPSNFVEVSAICESFGTFTHYPDQYYLNVKDMDYERTDECKFVSTSFDFDVASTELLKKAGIEEVLTEGTAVTFMSAPRYFGDSYWMPIVALEIDGEVWLDFDTGYKNLMSTYGVDVS